MDENGEIAGMEGVCRDITERKIAEKAFIESEEKYRLIVQNVDQIIYIVEIKGDPFKGQLSFISDKIESILGYHPDDFINNPELWFQSIHPDDIPSVLESTREIIRTGEKVLRFYRLRHKISGEYRYLEDSVVPKIENNKVVGFFGVARDVTERKRAEDELKNAKEEIERWNKELERRVKEKTEALMKSQAQLIQSEKLSAMGHLSAGLAHELNSPLAGLLPLIEKYRKQAEAGSEAYNELTLMLKASEHMAKVIRDFGSFARGGKGKFVDLVLNDVIEDTLSFSSSQFKKEGIQIITEYADKLPAIRGDKTELQQVVLNMITNARDAMPAGGKFVIKTGVSKDKNRVLMEFIDNGAGIPKENIDRIFDPFFTTKKQGEGMGLGLSVSYGIIKNHGGEISVRSEQGKETKFTVILPVQKA